MTSKLVQEPLSKVMSVFAARPPLAERHVFATLFRLFVCLFVCLFFSLFFRTNEMQAILLYFGTNEKLELEGILFMSGYPQIYRISQKIRIFPKKFYTPKFFLIFSFLLKMWIFLKIFFSSSGIFLKVWIFPKIFFLNFFFSRFLIFFEILDFSQKIRYPHFFLNLLGNFPYR